MSPAGWFTGISVSGLIDITVMTVVIYGTLLWLRRTRRTALILAGMMIVAVSYVIALWFDLVLTTAYTAFCAARSETEGALGGGGRTVVHTGFWGCGAFGGNRVLMVSLQVVAAVMAGLDGLVLHTVTEAGATDACARRRLRQG